MLNQTRINGLLKYMEQIGLEQMVIRNPVLIRYMLGYMPRGGDRATILYVSKNNGIKLIVNELTVFPKDLGVELVLHGDQDDVCALIAKHTLHDQPLGFDGEYPAKWLLPLRQHNAASDYVLADRALNLQRAHKDAKILADAQALAETISNLQLTISAKAEEGKLFGTVTATDLAEALAAKGVTIDRKAIAVEAVKTVGEYIAVAKLHREVKAEVKFSVVAAEEE